VSFGLFLGLTTVDLLFGVDRYPLEDSKNTARRYVAAAGGPATNAAVAFARLGGRARLLSSLGRGEIARIAAADLQIQGIDHHDLTAERVEDPALSAIAVSQDNGSRTIFTSPAIDDAAPFEANAAHLAECVAQADIVLLDGHQMALAQEAARIARGGGVPVVLDGDLYRDGLEDLMSFVDVAIFGKSFAMPGCATVAETMSKIASLGIRHVAATQGGDPIVFASNGQSGSIAIPPVTAIDTLAAGDFFHGAFCLRYSETSDVEQALRFASVVATRSIMAWGPREWLASL
jgi:sugar/nucleoside kinase (ribokinase family)